MSNKNSNVITKKVQPYPFKSVIEKDGKKLTVSVLKLTVHGFMIDMDNFFLKPAESLRVELELPAGKGQVLAKAKVVKTYNRFRGESDTKGKARRIAEIHFVPYPLPEEQRLKIKDFLNEIKQEA